MFSCTHSGWWRQERNASSSGTCQSTPNHIQVVLVPTKIFDSCFLANLTTECLSLFRSNTNVGLENKTKLMPISKFNQLVLTYLIMEASDSKRIIAYMALWFFASIFSLPFCFILLAFTSQIEICHYCSIFDQAFHVTLGEGL